MPRLPRDLLLEAHECRRASFIRVKLPELKETRITGADDGGWVVTGDKDSRDSSPALVNLRPKRASAHDLAAAAAADDVIE